MNQQRLVEVELLRLGSAPYTLGHQDSLDSRLYALGMLYRLNLIPDAVYLSLSVSLIKEWENLKKPDSMQASSD